MNWNLPKQTFFRDVAPFVGDCWRCCIAAVLQVPAETVPHFLLDTKQNGYCDVDENTQAWLNDRGFVLLFASKIYIPRKSSSTVALMPRIVCGPTPRSKKMGEHHSCVAVGEEIVYDPHPSEAGLTAITNEFMVLPLLPGKGGVA